MTAYPPCYVCNGTFTTNQFNSKVVERDGEGNPTKVVHRQGRCRLVHDGVIPSYDAKGMTIPKGQTRQVVKLVPPDPKKRRSWLHHKAENNIGKRRKKP